MQKLTTYTFQTITSGLVWKFDPVHIDETDEPKWAIWETECRIYRIVYYAATDTYSPRIMRETRTNVNTLARNWFKIATAVIDIEAAKNICEQHRRSNKRA